MKKIILLFSMCLMGNFAVAQGPPIIQAIQNNTNSFTLLPSGLSSSRPNPGLFPRDGNLGIGDNALNIISSSGNTAIGSYAISNNSGGQNTAVGTSALLNNASGSFSSSSNIAIGFSSMLNASGSSNIVIGVNSYKKGGGTDNTIVGSDVFSSPFGGSGYTTRNTIIGRMAMMNAGTSNFSPFNCNDNVAIGYSSLFVTNGTGNVAIGNYSSFKNVIGINNSATGYFSQNNNVGNYNTSDGAFSMSNTKGDYNTALGYSALSGTSSIGSALYNVAVGAGALQNNATGSYNTAVGSNAFFQNATGSYNVALGNNAGYFEQGFNTLYIANSNTTTPLIGGDFANGIVGIGMTVASLAANPTWKLQVAGDINASGSVRAAGVVLTSDRRFKKNIVPLDNSLTKILRLDGVNYYWRKQEFPDRKFGDEKQIGFIAQDIERIYPELVQTDAQGYKSINYMQLTPALVEAIKELNTKIEKLEKENSQLKTETSQLKADNKEFMQMKDEFAEIKALILKKKVEKQSADK